jgi:hypothetical protein
MCSHPCGTQIVVSLCVHRHKIIREVPKGFSRHLTLKYHFRFVLDINSLKSPCTLRRVLDFVSLATPSMLSVYHI